MGTLPKTDHLYTYADYKEWELKEGERYEIIHGEAFAMAAPGDLHQAILGELYAQFHVHLRGKPCKVRPAPYDVRLFYAEDESDDAVPVAVLPGLEILLEPVFAET